MSDNMSNYLGTENSQAELKATEPDEPKTEQPQLHNLTPS